MDIQINDMLLFVLSIGFKIQTRVIYMINKDLYCQTIYFTLYMHIYLILYLHILYFIHIYFAVGSKGLTQQVKMFLSFGPTLYLVTTMHYVYTLFLLLPFLITYHTKPVPNYIRIPPQ